MPSQHTWWSVLVMASDGVGLWQDESVMGQGWVGDGEGMGHEVHDGFTKRKRAVLNHAQDLATPIARLYRIKSIYLVCYSLL